MIIRHLHDTNLSEVAFGNNGQKLALTFSNMRNGHEEARLDCSGILVVKFHSASSPLPLYIGEVVHEEIGVNDSMLRLVELGYGFTNQDGAILGLRSGCLHFVHLEGGEIDIDVVCTEINFIGRE